MIPGDFLFSINGGLFLIIQITLQIYEVFWKVHKPEQF